MSFQKTFDDLLSEILDDYRAQIPDADTSKGSLIFIKSACMASALWGIYKHQEWISRQIFPDTADREYLERWAWLYAIERTAGESDSELLQRILDRIQSPPAGGNKADYIRWAKEVPNVKEAYCYPLGGGLGTVYVLILADEAATGSETPSSYADITGTTDAVGAPPDIKLIDSLTDFVTTGVQMGDKVINTGSGKTARVVSVDAPGELTLDTDIFTSVGQSYTIRSLTVETKIYIEGLQPIMAGEALSVISPPIKEQNITMTMTGANTDTIQAAADIEAYMKAMEPDETLYLAQLTTIAINNGAENVTFTLPASDVNTTNFEVIRPGTVTVV
ncbi:MAG: baseplate J/gp47 family protein [Deltaproteobacteria bacterium]|nr:baseplate J/gp47 family protein [Deltaproteobacteria bacterium]